MIGTEIARAVRPLSVAEEQERRKAASSEDVLAEPDGTLVERRAQIEVAPPRPATWD
jgi:hypothetical protein